MKSLPVIEAMPEALQIIIGNRFNPDLLWPVLLRTPTGETHFFLVKEGDELHAFFAELFRLVGIHQPGSPGVIELGNRKIPAWVFVNTSALL